MPRVLHAGRSESLLVDGGGDYAIDLAALAEPYRLLDIGVGGAARARTDLAVRQGGRINI